VFFSGGKIVDLRLANWHTLELRICDLQIKIADLRFADLHIKEIYGFAIAE
jgi:hypothetical protein